MPSAEDYLKQDVGSLVASLLFQIAMLRAELDRAKAESARHDSQPVGRD